MAIKEKTLYFTQAEYYLLIHIEFYISDIENNYFGWATDVINYISGQPPNVFSHHRVLVISGSTIKVDSLY